MIHFREYVCPQCGYPMCNLQCSSGQNHRLECEILSRCKAENRPKTLQIDGMKETNAYAIIAPLRLLLLLEANGDEWMRSNQLMDHQKGLYTYINGTAINPRRVCWDTYINLPKVSSTLSEYPVNHQIF